MALQTFNPTNMVAPRDTSLQNAIGKELENSFKRVQNKYAEPAAQAALGLSRAQAQEHQLKAQKLQKMLPILQMFSEAIGAQSGGDTGGQILGGGGSPMASGGQPPMQQSAGMPQQGAPSQQNMGQPQTRPQMSPLLENIGIQMMGGTPYSPMMTPENELIQPSYFGAPTTLYQGRKPEQIEAAKAQALLPIKQEEGFLKGDVEAYDTNAKELQKVDERNSVYDEIGNLMRDNPKVMDEIIGVLYSKKPDWTLSKEAGFLRGSVESLLGRLKVDTGKDIKGSWNSRDDILASQTNPVKGDTYPVFQGKWAAQQLINQRMKQRRELYATGIRDHKMREHEAAKWAESQTSLDAIRPQIDNTLVVAVDYNGETKYIPKSQLQKALSFKGVKKK